MVIIIYVCTIVYVVKFNRNFAGDLRVLLLAAISLSGGLALIFIKKEKTWTVSAFFFMYYVDNNYTAVI